MRWTAVSTGEMTMIANSRIVRRERFLADVTTLQYASHCCLDNVSIGGYDIFHAMC